MQTRQACSRASLRVAASSDEGHYDFDLFTIGAGTGGVRASRFAANFGRHFLIKAHLRLAMLADTQVMSPHPSTTALAFLANWADPDCLIDGALLACWLIGHAYAPILSA